MKILPLTYLGNIEYFAELISGGGEAVIDIGENYVKQTYRNRCEIMTASGMTALTVNVAGGRSMQKKAVKDMRIDYSKRWRHQHLVSLVSAYKNSPYFDHYWDRFRPLYEKEFTFLADLNRELLEALFAALKLSPRFSYSRDYIHAATTDTDLRGVFSPLPRNSLSGEMSGETRNNLFGEARNNTNHENQRLNPYFYPYFQVFSDKIPFTENLSAIDLLFCEGPAAIGIITSAIR